MLPLQLTTNDLSSQPHLEEILRMLRRESDLIHLAARGARIPTIRNLLGRVSDNKIKDINRRFHGDRKGAKTRGGDYYTETPARRRDASLIISQYQRLAQQNLPVVSMYVHLHNLYMRERTANPAFDIDELIRLACAIDIGRLKAERCPGCGALVVMQLNEVRPEKHCFVCNTHPVAKTRVRASTAAPIEFPPDEKISQVIDELVTPMRLATELVMVAARPQEVEIFVPGQEAYARKIWPLLNGRPAPQGSHPFTGLYYIEKLERRRHAAYIIRMFERLKKAGLHGAELFLALHRNYLAAFQSAAEVMHFSRIRGIVHFYLNGAMKLYRCKCCDGNYAILSDELAGEQSCPNCRMFADARKQAPSVRVEYVREAQSAMAPLPGELKRKRLQKKAGQNDRFSTAN